ncbi:MAG: germination protein YpeB [Clostridia bacterium]|nr:germination protein YpeB [Clostridia bacterium]
MNTKRILIVVSVIATITTTASVYQYRKSEMYRQNIQSAYQRAFVELVDYAGNIDVILNKALVSNDYLQLAELSEQLWTETALAKSALGQLPVATAELEKTSSFITQVSDYVHTLTKKLLNGEAITDDERSQISTLVKYSDSLNNDLKEMENEFMDGNLQLSEKLVKSALSENSQINLNQGLKTIEKSFEDYPTIIYDGPFAEHILNRKSEILSHPEISQKYAQEKAEKFTGTTLEYTGDSKGNIPSYMFSSKDDKIFIEISKNGGKVVMMTNSITVKNPQIEINDAAKIASDFLAENLYKDMKQTGYVLEGKIVNFAYAYTINDYTVYSDLIKIKVSLHDGTICGFESNGYLFNHKKRNVPDPVVSEENALANLNPDLEVEKVNMACIPRDNGTECWCYEIKAKHSDKTFLIYVNTQTGHEEEILLYVEDANGNLTV